MPLRPLHHNLLQRQPSVSDTSTPQRYSGPAACLFSDPDYFDSIDELISWQPKLPKTPYSDVSAGQADDAEAQTGELATGITFRDEPKLLVCHDFKGGYTENPFERGYSFEFWHLVDTFIYFSHKRITLPPQGWVDAGHRHGSKVLGTIIFEWKESKPDLQKCLYGIVPQDPNLTMKLSIEGVSFSTVCISQLVRLAKDRKLDGYLINVETDLNFLPPASCYPDDSQAEWEEDAASFKREQHLAGLKGLVTASVKTRREQRMARNASVLQNWVGLLMEEGRRLVGPHWQVIWYDSVTRDGLLQWQDALTTANAPFFGNSDGIFTNYTWASPPSPDPPGGLPQSSQPSECKVVHHPALTASAHLATSMGRSSADVYIGIDVFGRNCYGGDEIGRSLDLIFPLRNRNKTMESNISDSGMNPVDERELGLSVALFAPGWTWEHETEDGSERSWKEWWEDDLRFWIGHATAAVEFSGGSNNKEHAVGRYFGPRERHFLWKGTYPKSRGSGESTNPAASSPPSDVPDDKGDGQWTAPPPFYTNFGRGSGYSWWVYGRKVYDASSSSASDPPGKLGWTDIGSCFPKPDRVWPQLVPLYLDGTVLGRDTQGVHVLNRTSDVNWIVDRAAIIDFEAWQGGSSLEIVLRPGRNMSSNKPISADTNTSLAILPLCTLNACHITSQLPIVTLKTVVKLLPPPRTMGNFDTQIFQLQPYLIWANDGLNNECSYRLLSPSSSPATISELANGWYSSKVTLNLADAGALLSFKAVVPVAALGIRLSRPLLRDDLRILIGEIGLSAVPTRERGPARSLASLLTGTASSAGVLRWTPVPAPSAASPTSLWGILTWDDKDGARGDILSLSGYFNIFASVPRREKTSKDKEDHDAGLWLGTSTYERDSHSFVVAGLEPSDLVSVFDGCTELTSITFIVHRIGISGTATNEGTEGKKHSCDAEWRQELEVPLPL